MSNANKKFDLAERTNRYGKRAIQFSSSISITAVTRPLITQFVRAATSIGANYCEADQAQTKKDFIHKISICKKESRETMYWIDMIMEAFPATEKQGKELYQEAKELTMIFNKITKTAKENLKKATGH